ncbi:hypothetical protein [Halpernia sp. GG3]
MKNIVILFLCLFSFALKSQTTANYLNIPDPLVIDDTEYFLEWSKQASATLFLQQYLLKEEKITDFTKMINVSYFLKEINIDDAVKQKVESFQKRKDTDRFSKVQVTESPDGTEYIVDGLLTETPKTGSPYAEYGIYRFKTITNGSKKSFLIFSFIKRNYGDLKTSAKFLDKERNKLMGAAINFIIPPISLGTGSSEKK